LSKVLPQSSRAIGSKTGFHFRIITKKTNSLYLCFSLLLSDEKTNLLKHILIIQPAFIGDVILSTALVEKLHEHYPEAAIDVFLRKGNESLFFKHPYINKIFVWDKKYRKYQNLFKLIFQIRRTRYDLVVNVHRFFTSGVVSALSRGILKSGYRQNPLSRFYTFKTDFVIGNGIHEVERNHLLIAEWTDQKNANPKLYPSTQDREAIVQYVEKKPYITVSPASVWFTKQFPQERWVEFLKIRLPEKYTVYLLGGKGDVAVCETIKKSVNRLNVVNLAGKLSLLQSAALMQSATMNYVNDSAPLHLASSVNAPTTAVFCSTVTGFGFFPLADNSKVVEIDEKLACRPCGLHGKKICPEGHFKCAMNIDLKKMDIKNDETK